MTPEGRIKVWVKAWLDTHMPGHWRYSPRGGPFGVAGTPDLLICWRGIFISIEVKTDNGEVSALQLMQLKRIAAAGGIAAVVRGRDEIKMFKILDEALRKLNSLQP